MVGRRKSVFDDIEIRWVKQDGTTLSPKAKKAKAANPSMEMQPHHYIGKKDLYRLLLCPEDARPTSELFQSKYTPEQALNLINVWAKVTLSGVRISEKLVDAFKAEHGRELRAGDRISFVAHGNTLAPTDFNSVNGSVVVSTVESFEALGDVNDVVLEYTGLQEIALTPGVATAAEQPVGNSFYEVDSDELPW